MALRDRFTLRTAQFVRIALLVAFGAFSMILFSIHVSSRTYIPKLRGSADDDRNTDRMRRAEYLQSISEDGKRGVSGAPKIPSLSELKALRNTIDKVITVVEGESGIKSNGIKKIEPDNMSFTSPEENSKSAEKLKTLKLSQMRAAEIAFLKSIDKNSTIYYNGTFVRNIYAGRSLPKAKDSVYLNVTRLMPAADIPLHPLSQQEPYRTRMLGIQDSCRKHPNGEYTSYVDLKRLIRDDGHKSLLCVIPKAACTTWKSIMYYLTGKSKLEQAFQVDRSALVIDVGQIKSVARLSRQGIIARINNFTKFMVTRHPFSRLVSAYRNKFESRKPSYVMTHGRRIAQAMIQKYLGFTVIYTKQKKSDVLSRITGAPTFRRLDYKSQAAIMDIASRGYRGNITFEEFLRYGLVDTEEKVQSFDVHWRPQYFLCNPCAVNYDFLIRFEDLERESTKVLDYVQRNEPAKKRIKFPGGNPAAVTSSVTKKFFEKIPPDLKEAIRKIYEKDFLYFNYDPYAF